tara:strand:+ start:2987 stop:3469 length:483 start_codon:yes stop_codon:yes gene_type:complete
MARVTTEDCVESVPNRFELVIYACKRAREISAGSEIDVEKNNDKNTVVALREIAEKKLDLNDLKDSIVKDLQRYTPVEDVDLEDAESVPLKENASDISFDNFEKENASEKNRKKISVTESDIKKLIENNRKEMLEKKTDDTDLDLNDSKEEIIEDIAKID